MVIHRSAPGNGCRYPQNGILGLTPHSYRPTMNSMPRDLPDAVQDLLELHSGVLTRPQALRAGMTRKQLAVRLQGGRWQQLHMGVYAAFSGQPGRASMQWAALLRAGSEAVLSHQTAAELHGLLATPAPMIHVMVPSGHRVAPIRGVVLHYSWRLSQARHPVLLPPRTRVEETVLDLAAAASGLDDALGWIFLACGSRRTTPERIGAAMARRGRVRWRRELSAALGLGANGVHSLLEFRYVTRAERPHGLPAGRRQYQVTRAGRHQYQDVIYEDYAVVVELDGRAAHPAEHRWRDVRRDNANVAIGQVTLRYGWADVTQRPCLVAAQVGAALTQRGWSGAPRRCGPSCRLPV